MPILSIVVPVYNVASYLAQGLDSLLDQEFKDIEIICVNDGSTDDSLKIIQAFSFKDSRILIYNHVVNKGQSAARNSGIRKATGDYIAFFDPDDLVARNMYAKMVDAVYNKKIDVAMCGFKTFPEEQIIIPNFTPNKATDSYDFIKRNKNIRTRNDLCFSWRFIFRRNFLIQNNLNFIEEVRFGEDTVFNLSAIMKASLIILLPEPLYQYRINRYQDMKMHKYLPFLEKSLQLQTKEMVRLIKEYKIDQYTPITIDMSEYIVKTYTGMLLRNLKNNPNALNKVSDARRILSMSMIQDAIKVIGLRNIYSTWKEYLFYLTVKFKLFNISYKLYSR